MRTKHEDDYGMRALFADVWVLHAVRVTQDPPQTPAEKIKGLISQIASSHNPSLNSVKEERQGCAYTNPHLS